MSKEANIVLNLDHLYYITPKGSSSPNHLILPEGLLLLHRITSSPVHLRWWGALRGDGIT